jgi:NAD(P)H-flavin reductase
MSPTPARVVSARRETSDVVTLTLDVADRRLSFRPGQFNMLYAFGVGEVAVSMSGDPANSDVLVHTIRSVGAVTRALCSAPADGFLGVRGPYGTPWPIEAATGAHLLLVAGGLGLAPLRPVVYHAIAQRSSFRRVLLLAGARSPSDLLYRAELDDWQKAGDIDVLVTVDHASNDWNGRVGVVTALLEEVDLVPERTVAFVCGPEVMMRFTIRELGRRGLSDESIHVSMERNMKCAVGFCGHCQFGPSFVCKDGPVLRYDRIRRLFWLREA